MALSFIGKPISLISHSDIRYRGTLAGIDPQASTIQLENVFSMGTESRRPPAQYIAPVPEPYAYIVFRASEVKDLSVDEQAPAAPPSRSVHDDPAVLGASAPIAKPAYAAYGAQQPQQGYPQDGPPAPGPGPAGPVQNGQGQSQGSRGPHPHQQGGSHRPNSVHTATASLETVERAMSDLRVNGGPPHQGHAAGRGSGRRGRGGRPGGADASEHIKVPKTDFDFESSNAKFDKASAVLSPTGEGNTTTPGTPGEDGPEKTGDDLPKAAYNPKSSFFDSLSSSGAAAPVQGSGERGGGGRGRRGGAGGGRGGRTRRDEEREKNVATFGEPGGVGLLGPGAYVGGWGGYGRRGGRPRRGGGAGGARGGANAQATTARG